MPVIGWPWVGWALRLLALAVIVVALAWVLHAWQGRLGRRIRRYDTLVEEAAARNGISGNLVRAVIMQESRFDARCIGSHGEVGLMQITENAARDWYAVHGRAYAFRGHLADPRLNIEIGTWYLARGLNRWRDYQEAEVLALATYNAGLVKARQWAPKDPRDEALERIGFPSTLSYIRGVLRYRQEFDAGRIGGP